VPAATFDWTYRSMHSQTRPHTAIAPRGRARSARGGCLSACGSRAFRSQGRASPGGCCKRSFLDIRSFVWGRRLGSMHKLL